MVDQRQLHTLVGELSTENIKLPDTIPSFEKSFGETMVNKVMRDLKEQHYIDKISSSEVVVIEGKVVAKLNLVFIDVNIAQNVFKTKGASLHLSPRWSYNMINSKTIFITFEVK